MKSSYGDEQGCRAAVEAQGSFSVAVGDVRVDGDAGTAETTAVPDGGPNKGETLTVRLVDEDGVWKVDFVRSDAPAGPLTMPRIQVGDTFGGYQIEAVIGRGGRGSSTAPSSRSWGVRWRSR